LQPKLIPKAKPKLLLKRTTKSLLTQLQLRSDLEEDDNILVEDVDFHRGYTRPRLHSDFKLEDPEDDGEELDEAIRWRLFLARQVALLSVRR
jgi:hypothetical protein